jgi:hypothetical protein
MMIFLKRFAGICALLLVTAQAFSQQTGTVRGKVIDPFNQPIPDANIKVMDTDITTRSGEGGEFELVLPANVSYRIRFTHSTHSASQLELIVRPSAVHIHTVKMEIVETDEVIISAETDFSSTAQMQIFPIDATESVKMPMINPSFEAKLISQPGVAGVSEFSSQYRVRGGNYDENLVYVNGIEIYRPFLIRSGQQEGLGFVNPNLTEEVSFSTGGFPAQYGDKLSSVLDITYRDPRKFAASAEVGIITTNVHVEGRSANKKEPDQPGRWTFLAGARRFNTTYLLNSLDTKGDYKPNFYDVQAMVTFTPKRNRLAPKIRVRKDWTEDTLYYAPEKIKLTAFGTISRNRYLFEPEGSESTFGTIQQAFRLRTAFEGREATSYSTFLGALLLEHQPHARLRFSYTLTAFRADESELFDVEGGYLLSEVNTSFGSDEFGEDAFLLGVGTQFRHARNYLTTDVISVNAKGEWVPNNSYRHKLYFGLQAERQMTRDDLKEWQLLDSAGYVINEIGQFGVIEYIRSGTDLTADQLKAYIQDEWFLGPRKRLQLNTGVRVVYNDLLDTLMFSPRVQLMYDNSKKKGGANYRLRVAAGLYNQAPFYREFRRLDGTVNSNLKAQSALHLIVGGDYQIQIWNRPFKLFAEAYYKKLYNLIPFEIQNVRVRYYPDKLADGFAYGVDARINGEFIKGVDSWLSLGLLRTMEDVKGDEQGYVPRPTDQRVTFAMYFQDELPINPTYKVHVNYVYGSGIRFGPPTDFKNRTAFGFPAYHRVDLGFSKLITFQQRGDRMDKRGLESIWATVEIFNLFQRENTVAYTWIRDLFDRQFAVPNYLSSRLLNVRVVMRFR